LGDLLEERVRLIVMNHKVLVTGADGFIGSHLTETLTRLGHDVRALAYYNSFNSWGWLDDCAQDVKGNFEVVLGDIRDPHGVREAMRGCSKVVHLAALIAIPFSYHSPDLYVDTNIKGTLNVLQAAKELGVVRLVHTSTSEVYGSAQFVPITEKHPLVGQSPYSATKIAADQLVNAFHTSYGLPVITIRPFNTYGPRQSTRAVIPSIITQLANKTRALKVGALTPTRDFSYVDDTVSGFVAALDSDHGIGETLNLGSNFEISVLETVNLISELMGVSVETHSEEIRLRPASSEVERLWADNTRAQEILNWQPDYLGVSGFRKGLIRTIGWFTNPENLSKYKTGIYNL
jgi:dTDP-glucose 4,6-dehydratase